MSVPPASDYSGRWPARSRDEAPTAPCPTPTACPGAVLKSRLFFFSRSDIFAFISVSYFSFDIHVCLFLEYSVCFVYTEEMASWHVYGDGRRETWRLGMQTMPLWVSEWNVTNTLYHWSRRYQHQVLVMTSASLVPVPATGFRISVLGPLLPASILTFLRAVCSPVLRPISAGPAKWFPISTGKRGDGQCRAGCLLSAFAGIWSPNSSTYLYRQITASQAPLVAFRWSSVATETKTRHEKRCRWLSSNQSQARHG